MTEGELVTYLLERGLLSAECIANGSLRVTGTGGRNSTFRVTTASGPAYLVKEYRADDASSRREAALYSYLRRHSDIDLHSHVPAVRHDDPQSGVLVLEHIEGDDLRHLCARGRPPAAAARTAIVLADLHRLSATDLPTELYEPSIMETTVPVGLHRPDDRLFEFYSSASVEIIALLQTDRELGAALDRIADEWWPGALIHGDVRSRMSSRSAASPGSTRTSASSTGKPRPLGIRAGIWAVSSLSSFISGSSRCR